MRNGLDRIDIEILTHLQKDARLSNKELAARVGLAPSSCLERVRRLLRDRVLRGFHADVEPQALGIGLEAMISVRLQRHTRDVVDAFEGYARGLTEAITVYHTAGPVDFLVHVAVRDVNHLRDLAMDAFTSRPEVDRIQTSLIFKHERSEPLPDLRAL